MYSFISTVYHLCIILAVYCSRCLYHYFTVTPLPSHGPICGMIYDTHIFSYHLNINYRSGVYVA